MLAQTINVIGIQSVNFKLFYILGIYGVWVHLRLNLAQAVILIQETFDLVHVAAVKKYAFTRSAPSRNVGMPSRSAN